MKLSYCHMKMFIIYLKLLEDYVLILSKYNILSILPETII